VERRPVGATRSLSRCSCHRLYGSIDVFAFMKRYRDRLSRYGCPTRAYPEAAFRLWMRAEQLWPDVAFLVTL